MRSDNHSYQRAGEQDPFKTQIQGSPVAPDRPTYRQALDAPSRPRPAQDAAAFESSRVFFGAEDSRADAFRAVRDRILQRPDQAAQFARERRMPPQPEARPPLNRLLLEHVTNLSVFVEKTEAEIEDLHTQEQTNRHRKEGAWQNLKDRLAKRPPKQEVARQLLEAILEKRGAIANAKRQLQEMGADRAEKIPNWPSAQTIRALARPRWDNEMPDRAI